MEKILKSYLRRLSNLSGNNRSLQLLKILKEQFIDIHDFNFVNGEPSFKIISDLIEKKNSVYLCDEVDSRDVSGNELGKRLRKIQRKDKFLFEERGAKDLYIGWPFAKGKFLDGTIVRAPLIFFPIDISKEGNKWWLRKRTDVNITLNKTFLLAYYYYNGIAVDEDLVETVIEHYEKDSMVFRTQIYGLLKEANIELHFNTDNFTNELAFFKNYTKERLVKEEKNGILKLFPQAVLGIFPQAGSYLVPDYVKMLDANTEASMEDFLLKKTLGSSESKFLNDKVSEEKTFTPFPIDAYQEQALKRIKKGESIVIQGPPGSGKSQLISNTITDFIARGKSVLLVCQKRAALDVVYQRLSQNDMSDFTALVHDFKNDRRPIYEQIANQIESLDSFERKNNGLDTIRLERSFLQTSRRIGIIEEQLNDYKKALFDDAECGKSIKELYLTSEIDEPGIDINSEYAQFSYPTLPETLKRFRKYLELFEKFDKKDHFWVSGPSYAKFQTRDLPEIQKIMDDIPRFVGQLTEKAESFSFRKVNYETIEHFSQKSILIKQLKKGLEEDIVFKIYRQQHQEKPTEELPWLIQIEKTMMSCFRGSGMESSIKSENMGKFQVVLESAINARKKPVSWLKWLLFSHEKTLLKRVMVANGLKQTKEDFKILVKRIDNRLNFEDAISQILDNPWLHNFPYSFRKIDIQDWFYWQKRGLNMYNISVNIRTLNDYFPVSKISHTDYLDKLKQLDVLIEEMPKQLKKWNKYLSLTQIRTIIYKQKDNSKLKSLLKKDFDTICSYHQLKNSLKSEESVVLKKLLDLNFSVEKSISIFLNSLALAWINHIEIKYPELRMASTGTLKELEEELRSEVENKRQLSRQILLLKVREQTYEDVQYNRLKNRVTYRDLHHQVLKKRRIWPIRKVIAAFSEELFKLIPCWMCSPESASAIFPLKEEFDLVIFDEASQCFAERGIPSMYRGKQVMITGDSKQLRPNDLYRVKWDTEEDELDLNVESVLDLSTRYLPEVSLVGHYRSKSPALISFSNFHFYKNRLFLLPDRKFVNSDSPAIVYQHVNGEWSGGINEMEAEKVVELILELIQVDEGKSIGVVTFNFQQQEHILDLLDAKATEHKLIIPESIFVKNIENVQGDEKDIIIFSTGYAKDDKGKLKLQFGSLNVLGGENRLNVAITRAREKVFVITSIFPQDLKTDETKNEGPKLLKQYLKYAFEVSNGKWKPAASAAGNHPSEWFLSKKISRSAFHESEAELIHYFPFADLSVKIENQINGLILTDDNLYFQALSPKQIYAYEDYLLEAKNWFRQRFYSREYWVDRELTRDKIRKFVYQLS